MGRDENNPCYGCPDRYVTSDGHRCHDVCPAYQKASRKKTEKKEAIRKQNNLAYAYYSTTIGNNRNMKRGR